MRTTHSSPVHGQTAGSLVRMESGLRVLFLKCFLFFSKRFRCGGGSKRISAAQKWLDLHCINKFLSRIPLFWGIIDALGFSYSCSDAVQALSSAKSISADCSAKSGHTLNTASCSSVRLMPTFLYSESPDLLTRSHPLCPLTYCMACITAKCAFELTDGPHKCAELSFRRRRVA